jgi:hypothetical protein
MRTGCEPSASGPGHCERANESRGRCHHDQQRRRGVRTVVTPARAALPVQPAPMGAAPRHGKRRAISAVHGLRQRRFLGGGNSLPMTSSGRPHRHVPGFLVHSDNSFLCWPVSSLRRPLGIPEVDTPMTRLPCYIGFHRYAPRFNDRGERYVEHTMQEVQGLHRRSRVRRWRWGFG